jgi:hypothetical protein
MFTDDVVGEKAREFGQETGNVYCTRLIEVSVSSNIHTSYRSVYNVNNVQVKAYVFEILRQELTNLIINLLID